MKRLQHELNRLFADKKTKPVEKPLKRYAVAKGGKASPITKNGLIWQTKVGGRLYGNSRLGDLIEQLERDGISYLVERPE